MTMTTRFIVPDTTIGDPHQFALRASDLRLPSGDEQFYSEAHVAELQAHGVYLPVDIVTQQFDCDKQIGFVRRSDTWRDLYSACYDAHQCYDGWKDGDLLAVVVETVSPVDGTKSRAVVHFARIYDFHVEPITARADMRSPLPMIVAPTSVELAEAIR